EGVAAEEWVHGVRQVRHRLGERAEHLAPLVADVAHHLELLVDDHEELVDLLLVGEEVQERALALDRVAAAGEAEGAADRVHPHVADRAVPALHAYVALRARADEVAVAGEEAEGPVGAALTLAEALEDGQRLVGPPVGDPGSVVAADHEGGALALADLLGENLTDKLRVTR